MHHIKTQKQLTKPLLELDLNPESVLALNVLHLPNS